MRHEAPAPVVSLGIRPRKVNARRTFTQRRPCIPIKASQSSVTRVAFTLNHSPREAPPDSLRRPFQHVDMCRIKNNKCPTLHRSKLADRRGERRSHSCLQGPSNSCPTRNALDRSSRTSLTGCDSTHARHRIPQQRVIVNALKYHLLRGAYTLPNTTCLEPRYNTQPIFHCSWPLFEGTFKCAAQVSNARHDTVRDKDGANASRAPQLRTYRH